MDTSQSISSAQLTAATLQARLQSHTNTLILRLENILATLIPPSATTDPMTGETIPPQKSHTQTATEAFQLSVETTALIRACEQLMGLSRAMKEIWLSGHLDTLETDQEEAENADSHVKSTKGDQEKVLRALLKELTGKDVESVAGDGRDAAATGVIEVDTSKG